MTARKQKVRMQLEEKIPPKLEGLVDLAYNLWWSYHQRARDTFKLLDPALWYKSGHNPVYILRYTSEERLAKMAKKESFVKRFQDVYRDFHKEMHEEANLFWKRNYPEYADETIAYLSMEYGIHASLKIYSGGLGVLAGDHLKAASDLGIPLVAAGFLYQEGYFTQKINPQRNGWQEEIYKEVDYDNLPIEEVIDKETNEPLVVPIDFKDSRCWVKVWRVDVGRVDVYLMDSNIEKNPPWYRDLTDRLYGGGTELRFQQEMILGLGAVRLFEKLGIKPTAWHLNEGHCSFSSIERIHRLVKDKKLSFEEALSEVSKNTLFTTHTPVPAGHDTFSFRLIDSYFPETIKNLGKENIYALGAYGFGGGEEFNMTALGMRTADRFNGVSQLHAKVSKNMFSDLWDELKEKRGDQFQPLQPITNGVHVPSYVSASINHLFSQHRSDWRGQYHKEELWKELLDPKTISDYLIWQAHKREKERLFTHIRETARNKLRDGEWTNERAVVGGILLDPNALTIGFARRFATYKRATLIFTDHERIHKMITDKYRPVQFIFAGKAHPADNPGKKLIQDIYNQAKKHNCEHRVAFMEDYDIRMAKRLVAGTDVWLNTPRKPNEASGTSGMKAALNFVPNFSVLDGWWAEGYQAGSEDKAPNGWAINPEQKEVDSNERQDWIDAKSLYDILEDEIIPMYYDYEYGSIPYDWIEVMRQSFLTSMPKFSAQRMLKEYADKFYCQLFNNNH